MTHKVVSYDGNNMWFFPLTLFDEIQNRDYTYTNYFP